MRVIQLRTPEAIAHEQLRDLTERVEALERAQGLSWLERLVVALNPKKEGGTTHAR